MKLKEIQRTSTFAWSPTSQPLIATGTVAGALDASFSNDSQLEIWDPDFMNKSETWLGGLSQRGPAAFITTNSRFNRLAWGAVDAKKPKGIIAAGMENGELNLWDPAKILINADPSESLIFRNTEHTGSVRALEFNPLQKHLLASGGANGEIYVWDLKDPSKPYQPGARSSKLDEVTALSWNHQVAHVLGTSSSSGYTIVWDLRGKREVTALQYGGGAGTTGGSTVYQGGGVLAVGSRRGMSAIAWHPENATRLITASEDDSSPIIMVWDLRNSRAPEKILTGHDKGVLSLSWCKQDPDLLLSCGKDNRALCWNPQTSEIIGELPTANNWAFQVEWSPRNPDMFATAFFDGTIGIHSLQSTNDAALVAQPQNNVSSNDGADLFDQPSAFAPQPPLSLKQPPKWLRRPSSGSFGFGGRLVSVSNLPSAQGTNQSRVVHLRTVVTEPSIVQRAEKLRAAADSQDLSAFCVQQIADAEPTEVENWKALLSLFNANTRDELVSLLGFSKEDIAAQVADAVKTYKATPPLRTRPSSIAATRASDDAPLILSEGRPYVSFAEPEKHIPDSELEATEGYAGSEGPQSTGALEATPSEVSGSATSDFTKATEAESTATEPSLFGDEPMGTPQTDGAADFFSSMGTIRNAVPEHVLVPHHSYAADSSVAATVGSRASSVASEPLKGNTFKIYPAEESDIDRLVTKSLVLGDFESAVSLCLSADRFADAILLAARGGPTLLQRTQATYFERHTTSLPYLRLFQSVVTNDLVDIVQNADLKEWKEIFVVLCTFAKEEEFASLAKQLGQRLEFQGQIYKGSDAEGALQKSREFRKHALLCYLVAGKLEKLVNIWVEELNEDEAASSESGNSTSSRYAMHAKALQTFIEKVTIFRGATKYVDTDLSLPAESTGDGNLVRSYKLAELYNRYYEYADLLATQGLVQDSVKHIHMTPVDYKGTGGLQGDFVVIRDQLINAARKTALQGPTADVSARTTASNSTYPYASNATQNDQRASAYDPYASTGTVLASSAHGHYPAVRSGPENAPYTPASSQAYSANTAYNNYQPPPQAAFNRPSSLPPPPSGLQSMVPPPPPPLTSTLGAPSSGVPPPPPPKRDAGGWNDAPSIDPSRKTPQVNPSKTPSAITSPFPNATPFVPPGTPPPGPSGPPSRFHGQSPSPPPPPPRGGSGQGARPPSAATGPYPPPPNRGPPFQGPPGRPGSTGPGGAHPPRVMSPLNPNGGQSRGPPSQGSPSHFVSQGPQGAGQSSQTPLPPRQSHYGPPSGQPGGIPYPPTGAPRPPPGHIVPQQPPRGLERGPPPPGPPTPYSASLIGPRGPPQVSPGPPPGPTSAFRPAPPPTNASPTPPVPAPAAAVPLPPKYPPGDRSHIPDSDKFIFEVLGEEVKRMKQTTPPQQKRMADDTERRLNVLFDALNAGSISRIVVDQLSGLVQSMQSRDQRRALDQHVDLLTSGSRTDDIGLWMSGVKQLIVRL